MAGRVVVGVGGALPSGGGPEGRGARGAGEEEEEGEKGQEHAEKDKCSLSLKIGGEKFSVCLPACLYIRISVNACDPLASLSMSC